MNPGGEHSSSILITIPTVRSAWNPLPFVDQFFFLFVDKTLFSVPSGGAPDRNKKQTEREGDSAHLVSRLVLGGAPTRLYKRPPVVGPRFRLIRHRCSLPSDGTAIHPSIHFDLVGPAWFYSITCLSPNSNSFLLISESLRLISKLQATHKTHKPIWFLHSLFATIWACTPLSNRARADAKNWCSAKVTSAWTRRNSPSRPLPQLPHLAPLAARLPASDARNVRGEDCPNVSSLKHLPWHSLFQPLLRPPNGPRQPWQARTLVKKPAADQDLMPNVPTPHEYLNHNVYDITTP